YKHTEKRLMWNSSELRGRTSIGSCRSLAKISFEMGSVKIIEDYSAYNNADYSTYISRNN
ncbi:MAG: hypothetical protein M3239_05540, partial [Thermoproteota archaeon]|nr:hypothetical protein [Thermoproteota archaeon]